VLVRTVTTRPCFVPPVNFVAFVCPGLVGQWDEASVWMEKGEFTAEKKSNTAKNSDYVHAKCSSSTVLYTCRIGWMKQSNEKAK
jgi:hypothetical protein